MLRFTRPLLLAAALSFGVGDPAVASPAGGVQSLLEQIAAAPASRVAELLEGRRSEVDRALAQRARRFEDYRRAQANRDRMARQIEAMKRGEVQAAELKDALQQALVLDEEAQVGRSALLAAEAEVARTGAELLQLYDAVLAERRNAIGSVARGSANQQRLIDAYRKLAAQRDQVRGVLRPVLQPTGAEGASLREIAPQPDDDIETLLEKADLARDLEERYLRQAEQVRKRIIELESEQALARDVIGMARTEGLFDENDRRLLIERTGLLSGPQRASGGLLGGGASLNAAGATADRETDQAPPPADDNSRESADGADEPTAGAADDFDGDGAAAPSADPDLGGVTGSVDGDGFSNRGEQEPAISDTPTAGGAGSGPQSPGTGLGALGSTGSSVAEQGFVGPRAVSDRDLEALLNGEELSLDQLKRIEKALRVRASRIESEEGKIRATLRNQERRR